jgi:hypothetical protein
MRRFMKIMLLLLFAASGTVVVAQDGVISPADNLFVEEIPKIPFAMAEEIKRYTEFRYAGLSNWHPTRTQLTFSGKIDRWTESETGGIKPWLRESEYVVAEVTTPSLGVGYELGKATEWGKPILCLFRPSDGRALSAMIAGSNGVKVQRYQNVAQLREVFDEFFGVPQRVT